MFCIKCGSPLREGQKFCENCGAPVPQAKTEAQQPFGEQQAYTAQQPFAAPNPAPNDGRAHAVLDCTLKLAIIRFFRNYAEFNGRATRSEYWWAFLFDWAVMVVFGWIGQRFPIVQGIVALAMLLPGLSLFVRREHDIGRRWTRLFVGFIPVVGAILLIVDMATRSEGANRFGPEPLHVSQVSG